MPSLGGDYTELGGSKLKKGKGFLEPNFEPGPNWSCQSVGFDRYFGYIPGFIPGNDQRFLQPTRFHTIRLSQTRRYYPEVEALALHRANQLGLQAYYLSSRRVVAHCRRCDRRTSKNPDPRLNTD